MKINLNSESMLPEKVIFKTLNQEIDFDMSIVHYPSAMSNSGAYIFAPYSEEQKMMLTVLDV
jgi:hypothetical protein